LRLAGFTAHRTASLAGGRGSDLRRWWLDFERALRPPQSREEWLAEMEVWADNHNANLTRH
jgi:hypothetical protein